jgi:uncharacterized protein (TIGR02145 family)
MNDIIKIVVFASVVLFLFTSCNKDDENLHSQQTIPVVSTNELTDITQTTAISGGNITDDGGSAIIARGVCLSASQNPTISDLITEDGSGAGNFVSNIRDLEPNTTYYLRAYAINSTGTSYGKQLEFITLEGITGQPCPGTPAIIDFDGNIYNTVLIGDQCWMAENLKTTRDPSGYNILRYCYDNNTDYCNWYGGLYTWETIMNGESSINNNISGVQGICPNGWHLPGDEEWSRLIDYMIAQGFPNQKDDENGAGNALKSCRQINSPFGDDCNTIEHPRWSQHDTNHGFDAFGFLALPGELTENGTFMPPGSVGFWWSSTMTSDTDAWGRSIYRQYGHVIRNQYRKTLGLSVRCLKD